MAKKFVRDEVPLSRFGVLVAQLESIVASAAHKSPDPLLCFDLLSDLISALAEESKVTLFLTFRSSLDWNLHLPIVLFILKLTHSNG